MNGFPVSLPTLTSNQQFYYIQLASLTLSFPPFLPCSLPPYLEDHLPARGIISVINHAQINRFHVSCPLFTHKTSNCIALYYYYYLYTVEVPVHVAQIAFMSTNGANLILPVRRWRLLFHVPFQFIPPCLPHSLTHSLRPSVRPSEQRWRGIMPVINHA